MQAMYIGALLKQKRKPTKTNQTKPNQNSNKNKKPHEQNNKAKKKKMTPKNPPNNRATRGKILNLGHLKKNQFQELCVLC